MLGKSERFLLPGDSSGQDGQHTQRGEQHSTLKQQMGTTAVRKQHDAFFNAFFNTQQLLTAST